MTFHKSGLQLVLVLLITATETIQDCPNCVDKKCISSGECLKGCVPGFVDTDCKQPCPPNCMNNTCHIDRQIGTFVCSDGCQDGYCGSGCKRLCQKGCTTCDRATCSLCDVKPCIGNNFGTKCIPCSVNFEKCDKDTGQCIKCKQGFYGESCEKRCPLCLSRDEERQQTCQTGCDLCLSDPCLGGLYGSDCHLICPQNCRSKLCDRESGSCLRGCEAGFHGVRCDLTCNDACVAKTCIQDSGSCVQGCIFGYQKTNSGCKVEDGSHTVKTSVFVVIVAGLIACCIGLILCVFIIIYIRRRKLLQQGQSPEQERLLIYHDKTKAEVLERKTKDEIKWRTKNMVAVTGLSTAVQKFEEGEKWITITGNPGDGKTTLGYMVLQHFQDKMDVFKLDSPDDYRHISWKSRNRMILLDDIFGTFTSDESSIERWIPVLRTILESHELNNEAKTYDRIILTSRKNVVQDAQRFLERYGGKMLEAGRLLDLKTYKEKDERLQILEYHLQKNKIIVDAKQKQDTVNLETSHGFPYCCKVYSELRAEGKDINIVDFFQNPLTFLNETTKVLLKSTGCRQLFKSMIKNEGKFDINTVEDDRERQKMLVAASAEEGSYIWRNADGTCHFTNDSIHQSVLSTFASEDPLFVVKSASLTDILKYMVITSSDSDSKHISIKPLSSLLEPLGKRIYHSQIKEKNYSVFGERLCFNRLLCEAIVTHSVYSGQKWITPKQLIDAKDKQGTTMVTMAAMHDNTTAVDVLVTNHADVNIADERGMTPLHHLCGALKPKTEGWTNHEVNKACIELVINKGANVNKTDNNGRTPLHYLREHHEEERELIQLLEAAMK